MDNKVSSSNSTPARIFPRDERFDSSLKHTYTFFMLVKTKPLWLQMDIVDRRKFFGKAFVPILQQSKHVRFRYFDAEFFTTRCSDILVWETDDLIEYQAVIEKLRETLFWDTYYEIVEIIPAREDVYISAETLKQYT